MTNQEIAQTIIQQMGGFGRLQAMVGAKDFVALTPSESEAHGPGILFNFKGSRKANKCRVTLSWNDTYRFELYKYNRRTLKCPKVFEIDDIYCDMIIQIFEEETGLYLSL